MKVKDLYRYEGVNGGVVYSTVLLPMEHELYKRLVATNGKVLTDGEKIAHVIDIPAADLEKWSQIDAPELTEEGEAV